MNIIVVRVCVGVWVCMYAQAFLFYFLAGLASLISDAHIVAQVINHKRIYFQTYIVLLKQGHNMFLHVAFVHKTLLCFPLILLRPVSLV